ncbi:MAG: polysaccharide pyruvyl transferase family protein [Acidimicrobiia bacterium]|nr:polysaccharide pyruvyl transferase family protein [Acidimicrobiia bacterium]
MTGGSRERRRPVAIWGAYGGMNLGDEAILVSMVGLMRRHDLEPNVVITQSRPEPATVAAYARLGLSTVTFRDALALLRTARRCDLICGGGQLLDDRGGLGFPVGFTGALLLLNRVLGGRPTILGIGAEPITRRASKWMVKLLYSLAGSAMVRDRPSAAALSAAGYRMERVQVGGDVVLTLEVATEALAGSKRLLIVPNKDAQRAGGLEGAFETLARSARSAGWSVTVMAHDRRNEYDAGEVARLEKVLEDDSIEYLVPASLEEGLAAYRSSDVVASARMHPLILALLHNVRPLAIPVVPKVDTLVEDMKLLSVAPGASGDEMLAELDAAAAWDGAGAAQIIDERRAAIDRFVAASFNRERNPAEGGA